MNTDYKLGLLTLLHSVKRSGVDIQRRMVRAHTQKCILFGISDARRR